jgi:hypothetical protein
MVWTAVSWGTAFLSFSELGKRIREKLAGF